MEIIFNVRDLKGYPHIFDHAPLRYDTIDMARRCPIIQIQGGGPKPESTITFEQKEIVV